jgi:hypothetical protein
MGPTHRSICRVSGRYPGDGLYRLWTSIALKAITEIDPTKYLYDRANQLTFDKRESFALTTS